MCSRTRKLGSTLLALVGVYANGAIAAETSLNIPTQTDGFPTDVGLMIIGHSTSEVGSYPAKLVQVLNGANDGRNYVALPVVTGGDGGFLWSRAKVMPGDVLYNRFTASKQDKQWVETSDGTRWSCRRLKVDRALGVAEATTACSESVENNKVQPVHCVWNDATGHHDEYDVPWQTCWQHMDVRIALVQDTSNRSWPIDDYNRDGSVTPTDYFVEGRVGAPQVTVNYSCPEGSPNPSGKRPYATQAGNVLAVDWDCDNKLTANGDGAIRLAARWLVDLATHLRTNGVDYVFFTQKPMEMTVEPADCAKFFPSENCEGALHVDRLPENITPSRPMTKFYLPSVYWEYRVMEALTDIATFDATRMFVINPDNTQYMWDESVTCYEVGMSAADWTIPQALPPMQRDFPGDTGESDGQNGDSASRGCMGADHVHHIAKGGWMMADVWYRGLFPYLQ